MKRFAAGDYGASVPVRTRDEIGQLCSAFNGMVEDLREKNVVIQNKNRENEELLLNVLPAPIANRLRGGEEEIADGFAEVTVAFRTWRVTELTSDMPPHEVVTFLNGLFTRFDVAANDLGIWPLQPRPELFRAWPQQGLFADHGRRLHRGNLHRWAIARHRPQRRSAARARAHPSRLSVEGLAPRIG